MRKIEVSSNACQSSKESLRKEKKKKRKKIYYDGKTKRIHP
jgi:hypothetical protein